MAIIVCGDTHGYQDIGKVTDFFENNESYTKEDYLIILGDVGVLWDGGNHDRYVQQLLEELPVTILWIDGNHENFDMLEEFPVSEWHGGKVHFISDSIIHLMRGQIFEIEGKTFFTFGGGLSIDRIYRTEGESWWAREMPSVEEYREAMVNLENVGWRVDYILTHTCPGYIANQLVSHIYPGEETLQRFFDTIAGYANYDRWLFGHWHVDEEIDNFLAMYQEIFELE